jgi:hypothetical protein
MNDRAMCAVAGVRKPPKNEPAGDVHGRYPHSAMGIWLKWKAGATDRHAPRASNDAPGGKQKQVLMFGVAVEVAIAGSI